MELISDSTYIDKIKLMKFKPTNLKIPQNVITIINENNLIDMPNVNDRAKIFLKAMYLRNLKSSTIINYFNKLKPVLFPNTTIIPNSLVFDDSYTKQVQQRGSNINKIKKFINYVKFEVPNKSLYKWPILISTYTGLRLNEVCNIHMSHLNMLMQEKPVIPLKRKNNKDWEVIYYEEFKDVIKEVIKYNTNKYKLYTEFMIDSKLFPYSNQALHQNIKYFYLIANQEKPPIGFGLHSVRYYLATTLYNDTNKIEIAQALLGHSRPYTTERYIKHDITKRKRELEQLSQNVNLYKNIKKFVKN